MVCPTIGVLNNPPELDTPGGQDAARLGAGGSLPRPSFFGEAIPSGLLATCFLRPQAERGAGEACPPSSSQSHNYNASIADEDNGQQSLPFRLTGSAAKTAFALRHNLEWMVRDAGVNCVGFLTLTVGEEWQGADDGDGSAFVPLRDAGEANKRLKSLNAGLLSEMFERYAIVSERTKRKAVHFHLLGVLRGRPDIRTGFDFEAMRARGNTGASDALRALWETLNARLPGYGFGRAQLTPIETTGGQIASYVSKYIEKHLFNRVQDDKGRKLVRYSGFAKHLKANDFGWCSEGSREWRLNAQAIAHFCARQTEPEQVAESLGPRWALRLSEMMRSESESLPDCLEWVRELWGRAEHLHGFKRQRESVEYWETVAEWDAIRAEAQRPIPGDVQEMLWQENGVLIFGGNGWTRAAIAA